MTLERTVRGKRAETTYYVDSNAAALSHFVSKATLKRGIKGEKKIQLSMH
jgi:hypothetical protein